MLGLVKRLGALALLLGLLVGFPALLLAAVGNPWPDGGLNELSLMSNSAVLGIVSLLGWFVWAQLLLCTLWEIPPALRHETEGASRLPIAVGGQQRFIRMLVHTVLAVGVTSTTLLGSHAATAEAAPAAPLRPVTHVAHQAPAANPETSPAASPVNAAPDTTQDHRADPPRIVTDKGDTLWGLAEKHLGDGFRWQEIADLNHGRAMSDGRTFNNPRSIEPGWELLLPADATNLPGDQTTETEHVVAPGETLTGITKETTGDPDNWQALYEANKDVIGSDPGLIYPGQVLVLPGAGAVDPATGTDRQPQREPGQRDHVPGKSTDGQDGRETTRGPTVPPGSTTRPGRTSNGRPRSRRPRPHRRKDRRRRPRPARSTSPPKPTRPATRAGSRACERCWPPPRVCRWEPSDWWPPTVVASSGGAGSAARSHRLPTSSWKWSRRSSRTAQRRRRMSRSSTGLCGTSPRAARWRATRFPSWAPPCWAMRT